MEFLQELYLGETLSEKVKQIVKKIKNSQAVPDLYLIAMASHPDNMLELVPQTDILQKGYPSENMRIIGLAGNKKEAISLVQFIIEEAVLVTGSADVRSYLNEKWEGQACI